MSRSAASGVPGRTRRPFLRVRPGPLAVVGISWGSALLAVGLSVAHGLPVVARGEFVSLYLLQAVAWGGVSALVLTLRTNPVGILLAATAIGSGLSAVSAQFARIPGAGLLDPGFSAHVLERLWMPGTLVTLSVVPLLLTTRPATRATRLLVGAGILAAVVALLASIPRQRPTAPPNPLAVDLPLVQEVAVAAFVGALAVSVAIAIVTDIVLIVRWRRRPAEDRRGLGWLVLGQSLVVVFFGPTFLPWLSAPILDFSTYSPLVQPLAVVFMVVAVVAVTLGQRLWGIDIAVNRVVVDVLLLLVLVLLYTSIAIPISILLPVPPTIAGAAGVAAFAVALAPIRRWVRARVDALVYGDAADPAQLLARLGTRPGRTDAGLADLVAELRETLRLGRLEVRTAETEEPVVATARTAGVGTVLPLRSATGIVGWLHAEGPDGRRLDSGTRQVLERIAGVLVVTLQLETVNRELAETRDRALVVGAEERRMVRYELRDGLAPALAASVERLSGLPRLTRTDLAAARSEVAAVHREIAARAMEVRDLARTLVPGALDAGDFDAALAELAARFTGDRLAVSTYSRGAIDLDPVRQSALHHLAAEAVLLLRRVEGVRRAVIRVVVEEGCAELTIEADAPFTRSRRAAPTLSSLADRADDLGAELELIPAGTGIRVTVPR